MFTSSAGVFRIRQSVSDLRAHLRASGSPVRVRLASAVSSGVGPADALRHLNQIVDDQGGRFRDPADAEYLDVIRLAAAMPSDDYPAFTFSTALLLLDRLQRGAGQDDLYWNWDAFREEYALADAPVRAALMNAFRFGGESGLLAIDAPPSEEQCLTRTRDEVAALVKTDGATWLADLIDSDLGAEAAGSLWASASRSGLGRADIAVFRYLYERPVSFLPVDPAGAALIPWTVD